VFWILINIHIGYVYVKPILLPVVGCIGNFSTGEGERDSGSGLRLLKGGDDVWGLWNNTYYEIMLYDLLVLPFVL
jgi:hypothetical protein